SEPGAAFAALAEPFLYSAGMIDSHEPARSAAPSTLASVRDAATKLAGVANRTPVLTSRNLDALVGASIHLKCESFQRSGSFKFRGAYNALARIPARFRDNGVITYSSGNHAQAVALAGRLLRIPVTVVMPLNAPAPKLEATRDYG